MSNGDVRCDPSGRENGRGAYLSVDTGSVQTALVRGILSKHLGVPIDWDQAEMLMTQVERERARRLTGSAR